MENNTLMTWLHRLLLVSLLGLFPTRALLTTTPYPTTAFHRQCLVEGILKGEDISIESLEFLERSWTPILTKEFFDLVVKGEWDLLYSSQCPPPADPFM